MKKLESTLKNMMLSLTCITIVAAAALAGVNMLTEATINAQKEQQQQAAISAVLPEHARIADAEQVGEQTIYRAYDANEQFVGAAVQTVTNGFGGKIKLMVGFDADNRIVNYAILEQQETPGLGTHIVEWFKNEAKPGQNILGRQATGQMTVSKDGGDVDAITAATISSRAFLSAVNAAYAALNGGDAMTGASQQQFATPEQVETVSSDAEQQVTNDFVSQD
ncbi:MAG: RnfABCDGE type electron transport complex subunit G [Paludibacteraceae bacterium]|nr:RnfABCDGE type electron transport complex subunit G [Paludibacteraceae bacterium]